MKAGLRDWKLQRLSAMMISVLAIPLLLEWFCGCLTQDYLWYELLATDIGKVITLTGLIGFAIHSYLGMMVVITDYVPRKFQEVALVLLANWVIILFGYGLYLIWIF